MAKGGSASIEKGSRNRPGLSHRPALYAGLEGRAKEFRGMPTLNKMRISPLCWPALLTDGNVVGPLSRDATGLGLAGPPRVTAA